MTRCVHTDAVSELPVCFAFETPAMLSTKNNPICHICPYSGACVTSKGKQWFFWWNNPAFQRNWPKLENRQICQNSAVCCEDIINSSHHKHSMNPLDNYHNVSVHLSLSTTGVLGEFCCLRNKIHARCDGSLLPRIASRIKLNRTWK